MTFNLEQELEKVGSLPDNWTAYVVNEVWEYDRIPKEQRDASPIDEEMSSIVAAIYLLDPNAAGLAFACRCTPRNDPDAEPMPVIYLIADTLEVFKTAPATTTPVHIYLVSESQWWGFSPQMEARMRGQGVSDKVQPQQDIESVESRSICVVN
ncbi:hypothetical protein Hypma_003825 [Hypsizygus marmoreus]|uniref:Uncharacterized protein n=1 Tax=Hypsizygus marmoreus TaxID=39966 RepID=A0A369K267_HYPMA|nr:hypothetical protein Hypma_003825 [Hypsizygus marmoreus]